MYINYVTFVMMRIPRYGAFIYLFKTPYKQN